jgi:hypothetical protein
MYILGIYSFLITCVFTYLIAIREVGWTESVNFTKSMKITWICCSAPIIVFIIIATMQNAPFISK